ncbi:NAD+ synthase [Candidatus Halobonum tyrrellensis]|uniref:NH(3)-dependent NAD(+) synthetase n=1 Tax=Candidatus Halobonum tyrrellensis G22 TaxID=1324957 RepID=V4H9G4_9EURY|nr:NAD+ synthase [Candidatus Halobonum tyrrellensis]ESP87315.1 NAD synthetase [Candidatus Halobonum tyrrellensis G22]
MSETSETGESDESVLLSEEPPLDLRLSGSELEATREHLVEFVASQVDAAGADGAVLGLSGGIDSTTVAYLAVEALGADSVHGLVMPGKVNTDENMSDAERVAEDLGIEYDVVEIEPIAESFYDALPGAADEHMAASNVRVRVRAVLNYFVANAESLLVLGTGNYSEAATGYFTKYGDGAVDCLPLGNLYKQQVRQLAKRMGVPHDLVMKTPSAEMWTGQTDEEELGMDYDTLDAVLALHVEGPLSTAATTRYVDVTEDQVERVEQLYDVSKHKRAFPPAPDELRL